MFHTIAHRPIKRHCTLASVEFNPVQSDITLPINGIYTYMRLVPITWSLLCFSAFLYILFQYTEIH